MKKQSFLLVFLLIIALGSCLEEAEKSSPKIDKALLTEGFQLLESNCFSCHSPNADIEKRVAPPMIAIKKHYIDSETSLEDFTSALTNFVQNPTAENSKMPGALERFGVMPKMNFSEAQIEAIAAYIYHEELEAPDWFAKHYKDEQQKYLKEDESISPMELGLKYAMTTKAVLGKNLMSAIQTKGTDGALEFCNTKAYPLTDSMATALNIQIKRVSDLPRNPNNEANEMELEYIKTTKEKIQKSEKPTPFIHEVAGKTIGYYPIMTNEMCMQCHGKSETEIKPTTLKKIAKLYPNDKAKEYKVNNLRGIWVVEMPKK